MARPVSWLPRLNEIRRSVKNSVRSHYDRKDLEVLFKLQPRAANSLLEMLPVVEIGRAHLVEREALAAFLDRVHTAEDVAAACLAQRKEKQAATRRKPRALVRRDQEKILASTLHRWMTCGHLHVDFQSAQELFDVLWRVASALQEDLEAFIELYEAERPAAADHEAEQARNDVVALFEELECLDRSKERQEKQ
jgi:hypothetical protein